MYTLGYNSGTGTTSMWEKKKKKKRKDAEYWCFSLGSHREFGHRRRGPGRDSWWRREVNIVGDS